MVARAKTILYRKSRTENQARADALYHKLWSKEHHHLQKVKVLMHYSIPSGTTICTHCGEQDVDTLCIDHVNGGGGQHRKSLKISGSRFYDWLIGQCYPVGFQVLCYNCNMKKERLEY